MSSRRDEMKIINTTGKIGRAKFDTMIACFHIVVQDSLNFLSGAVENLQRDMIAPGECKENTRTGVEGVGIVLEQTDGLRHDESRFTHRGCHA